MPSVKALLTTAAIVLVVVAADKYLGVTDMVISKLPKK